MTDAAVLARKVILITGASGSFGGAVARELARHGVTVICSGRNVRRLDRLHAAIEEEGGACQLYPMDLAGAQPADFEECVDRIVAAHGQLDALLHCAADFPGLTPLRHADPGRLAQTIHVNLTARLWLTQAALPALEAANGCVLMVHDDPAQVASAYWGGYGLVQSSQQSLVAMLRGELSSGVAIAAFQPAPMPTALRARAYSHEVTGVRHVDAEAQRCVAALCGVLTGSGRRADCPMTI